MSVLRLLPFLLFLVTFTLKAEQMSISYGSPSWNNDSTVVDSAYLMMRDKETGKIIQVQLEETEPDSSEFSGRFSVSAGKSGKFAPEVFVPPEALRKTDKDNRKLYQLIQANKLPRKPLITKKDEKGQTLLDVYDTRAQAEAALKAWHAQERLAKEMKQNALVKPIGNEASLEVAKRAERKQQLDQLAMEAAKREAERIRLDQIERQKALDRDQAAKAATAQERARRKAKAQTLSNEAMAHFEKGEFPQAEEKFRESVDLDPASKEHYFKYGITLYRNEKFNEALVVLNLAKIDDSLEAERQYYVGLIHYRLKELDKAVEAFSKVSRTTHQLAVPAVFYRGVVYYAQDEFDLAKKDFETVIDTSTDPRLDEQAEQYLDRIATAMIYQKLREQKFTLMGVVGLMYDSNVLLAPDSSPDQGSATDLADFRLLTIADLEYRPWFTEHHEFSPKINAGLTNSSDEEAAKADPWIYNLSLPYTYKGMIWNKGARLTVKPGYETLMMAPSGGTKAQILNSMFLSLESTFVMRSNWFSTYGLEYRMDDSRLPSSEGPNDGDAGKYTLRTSQTMYLDKAKKEALIASLGYVLNGAKGDNEKYNRIEAGALYSRPTNWNASWNFGLNFYKLKYGDADEPRDDFNSTLSTGISKPVKDWVIWGVTASYTKNDSNIDDYEYSKYMVLTTATFLTSF